MKQQKTIFCKKCGAKVDSKTKKCTNCGKQYFKFRITYLLLIICLIELVVLFCILISHYNKNNERPNEGSITTTESITPTESIAPTSTPNPYKSGIVSIPKIIYEDYKNGKISEETYDSYFEYFKKDQIPPDYACKVSNCNKIKKTDSDYCTAHGCIHYGCYNRKANNITSYCVDHKCLLSSCNFAAAYDSFYCHLHN